MNTDNSVVFKANKNGIIIMLDEQISYDNLKDHFRKKLLLARDFFGNCNTSISFKGRDLSEPEEEELLDIIFKETGLSISYVGDLVKNTKSSLAKKEFNPNENLTHFHKGSIRSGQSILFDGSVVVVGDINPGGLISAKGNVIVLGKLKGFVHAGSSGDDNCFVSAFLMQPTQLRIGNLFSYIPKEITNKNKNKKKIEPSYAYVLDGKIYIENL